MGVGAFYVCPTPLGHLKDITLRTLEVLQHVDYILAEDTRRTLKLLNHYQIHKPLKACHAHNECQWVERLLANLNQGQSVALVSDAGMPLLSDPGYGLVQAVQAASLPLVVLPGPSAVTLALAYSGFAPLPFMFIGFLPRRQTERQKVLRQYTQQAATLVCFEAPHRLRQTLTDCESLLGNRSIAVCRELTKVHEQIHRGTATELATYFQQHPPQGEITVVIAGHAEPMIDEPTTEILQESFEALVAEGLSTNAAIKRLAKHYQMPRNQLYEQFGRK